MQFAPPEVTKIFCDSLQNVRSFTTWQRLHQQQTFKKTLSVKTLLNVLCTSIFFAGIKRCRTISVHCLSLHATRRMELDLYNRRLECVTVTTCSHWSRLAAPNQNYTKTMRYFLQSTDDRSSTIMIFATVKRFCLTKVSSRYRRKVAAVDGEAT
jgi:hypothetical protein